MIRLLKSASRLSGKADKEFADSVLEVSIGINRHVIKASRYRGSEHFLNGVTLVVPAVLVVLNNYMPEGCIIV